MPRTALRHRRHPKNYNLNQDIKNIKRAFADAANDTKGKAEQILINSYDDLKERSIDIEENIADYIAEKPFQSVGIALLSGFIIGLWMHK